MLTTEEKGQMINAQLKKYEQMIFQNDMLIAALLANDDTEGAKMIESKTAGFRKAYAAVEAMKEG